MTPDILTNFSSEPARATARANDQPTTQKDGGFRKTLEAEDRETVSEKRRAEQDAEPTKKTQNNVQTDAEQRVTRSDQVDSGDAHQDETSAGMTPEETAPSSPVALFAPLPLPADLQANAALPAADRLPPGMSDALEALGLQPLPDASGTTVPLEPGSASGAQSGGAAAAELISGALMTLRQVMSGQTGDKTAVSALRDSVFSQDMLSALSQGDGPELKTVTQAVQNAVQMAQRQDSATTPVWVSQLPAQAGTEAWQHQLGEKILWLVGQKLHEARIHLNPADLGPIDIQIQIHKDQAQIQMHATQALTRDMLDAAAWRLRETLAGQGLNLSGFDVSDQPAWQQSEREPGQPSGGGGADTDLALETVEDLTERPVMMRVTDIPGLVDTYA